MNLLPLPEPPAHEVGLVLDELRQVRRELDDASRIVAILGQSADLNVTEFHWRRLRIEQAVAERRCELWTAQLRRVEGRARALGLDVTSTL